MNPALTNDTGPVEAEGRVVTVGRRVAFAEAWLKDARGKLLASATSTLRTTVTGPRL